MKIDSDKFRVNPGKAIKLSKLPTNIKPLCDTKEKYQSVLTQHVSDLSDLQHLHYASNRYALLLIFQGWMARARTGHSPRHVGINPEGCDVSSFKQQPPRNWSMIFSGVDL